MATRVVEWKKPYTWGKAISIDENKVISLNLRDENNLIIYDEWDDEIYVDLQLDDEITPTSAFPIWVNVGRVIVDNWWDKPGTIISAETTSGDNIKIFYADEWTLWIDNWTGTFKQIYFKADVDALLLALRNYIDWELAKKQNWVSSDAAPSNPSEWDLWYDTTSSAMKVWDWTAWQSVWWWSDIVYATKAEYNALLPWALTDNKHYFIYIGDSRLPAEYQEVEYIQSSWAQWIDTWLYADQDTVVETRWNLVWYNRNIQYDKIYWTYWNNGTNCFFLQSNRPHDYKVRAQNYINPEVLYNIDSLSPINPGEDYTTIHSNTEFTINWVSQGTCTSSTYTSPSTITIFALHDWSSVTQSVYLKLYSFKMYSWTTLERDFVPGYRKSDSVIWLYDLVNDVFYTNSWTWTFTKWPNV